LEDSEVKNVLISTLVATAILHAAALDVFAWGPATHAYIVRELCGENGASDLQKMYGSVLPDMFNLSFGYEHYDYLWTETHYGFMKVVDQAASGGEKSCAYGFASHNEQWGADRTAHISAATAPGEGYVIAKRAILAAMLGPAVEAVLTANGVAPTPEMVEDISLAFADTAVEFAVDLLVAENEDELIGIRVLLAAKLRDPLVPGLLCRAYAEDFADEASIGLHEAIAVIAQTERQFKGYMELYGAILAQENAADLMAVVGTKLAEMQLKELYGLDVTLPVPLIRVCLLLAVELVRPDYAAELAATIDYVDEQLKAHCVQPGLSAGVPQTDGIAEVLF
jgi:hypothetical protein